MATIRVLERGIPGPAGAGVTPAQLAGKVDDTGDTMSGPLIVAADSGGGLIVRKVDGTVLLNVNTTSLIVDIANGGQIKFWAGSPGAGSSAILFDAATGVISFGLAASTPSIRKGAGSPEGVVTATVGSLFLRTDGGASTTLYVKQSGSGNTGWAAK